MVVVEEEEAEEGVVSVDVEAQEVVEGLQLGSSDSGSGCEAGFEIDLGCG